MNQHYVPRVFLKYFAERRNGEYYVDVYDKEKEQFFNTNITNICADRNFYTLDEDNKVATDILAVEKIYAGGLEPMYERVYNILTNDSKIQISDIERVEILLATFQLYMRNPRILKISIQHHSRIIKSLCNEARIKHQKGITYLDEDFSFREWTDEDIIEHFKNKTTKSFKEGHITGIGEMGTFHEFSKIEVTKAINESYYFTSDNPLVVEDLVNPDVHPLEKTNEFILTLSPLYSVRILHDNKIAINTIKRTISPSGNTAMTNNTVFKQAIRFIIGSRKFIEEYFKMESFLNDSSLKTKIDAMRQIVSKFKITPENAKMTQLFKDYLEKYDKNNGLTLSEEQELYRLLKQLSINGKKTRL